MNDKPLTLDQMDMLMQFPDEDYHDVYCGEGEPEEEFHYPLIYDEVLTVDISNNEGLARLKLERLMHSRNSKPVGKMFYTGRHWCQRISR